MPNNLQLPSGVGIIIIFKFADHLCRHVEFQDRAYGLNLTLNEMNQPTATVDAKCTFKPEGRRNMFPSGITILNEYYSMCWTLHKFIQNKQFCGIKIGENAGSLTNWLKSVVISFPHSSRKFEKPKTIKICQNYERDILPAIKLKKKKFTNDVFNVCVKNDNGKVVAENWRFFGTTEWTNVHKLVGDEIIQFVLMECAIFKRESTTLLQKSGISLERLHLKRYIARKEAKDQTRQSTARQKRPFPEAGMRERAEPAIKRRKIEAGKEEEKTKEKKKTYRGRKKKIREKMFPGFQHSFEIAHAKILYNALKNERFPSKHVLNTRDATKLKKKMFSTSVKDETDEQNSRSRIVDGLVEMDVVLKNAEIERIFEKFLCSHKKFDYDKCLRRNCGVPRLSEEMSSHSYNTRSQVLNFLRLVLYQVVPKELLGSGKNQRVMYHNLKKLVFAGKFDRFCLGQMMTKFRIKDCKWIGKEDGICLRDKIVSKMVLWLLTDYFMTILKSYFYVTDTSFGCHQLFYYRQSKWRKLCKVKIDQLIASGVLRRVKNKEEVGKLKNEGFGVGNLRFTPKVSGLRPLVAQTKQKETDLVKLRHVLCVLKYAIRRNAALIGYGSQSVRTAREQWAQFKKSTAPNLKYYFVRVDVKDCFHSMIQDKLLEILERVYDDLYRSSSYVRIAEVDFFRRLRAGVFRHRVLVAGDMRDSLEKMLDDNKASFVNEKVIVDTGKRIVMTKPRMRSRLKRYVCSLLCTLPASACGNEQPTFHQVQGIVQGQMLSSILCNIYYGAMDNEYLLKYTEKAGNFLVRLIDDYLFVTPNIDEANRFLAQMVAGFSDFNSKINSAKCCTNLREMSEIFPEIQTVSDEARMSWLGSKIDITTLDIFIDYTRYGGIDTDSTVARQFWKSSTFMKDKVFNSLKSKCSECIYFDESCNSITCVAQNVYELFLIAAFRLVSFIRFSGRNKSADYIFDIIRTCSDSVFKILSRLKRKLDVATSLTKFDIYYLSLRAFETKFMTLLTWRQLGRKLRFRRTKMLEKTNKTIMDSIDTFPKDFSNLY